MFSTRLISMFLALFAYAANGAQPHLHFTPGETLTLAMCSLHGPGEVTVTVGEGPAQETADTCCGDCTVVAGTVPPKVSLPIRIALKPIQGSMPVPAAVSPRSPLWPGAPPQGPPLFSPIA
ncbi:MAG: hypothetical protein AAGF20_04060 [Pseudomonadota bacterium]